MVNRLHKRQLTKDTHLKRFKHYYVYDIAKKEVLYGSRSEGLCFQFMIDHPERAYRVFRTYEDEEFNKWIKGETSER